MAYRQFCSHVACPNYREITIMGEIGDDVFFCDEHASTKYVRCAEEYCSNLWVFDYDHEVPSAPKEGATDWRCEDHRPKLVLPPLTRMPDLTPVADMNETELREHIAELKEYHENDIQYKDIELREVRDENNLLALDKAACVLDIKHLNEMVDFALTALEKIHSDPEADGPGNFGSDTDLWVETVAKETIDEIRRRRA